MAQTAPNRNAIALPTRPRSISGRIAAALAGSTCAFALMLPFASPSALAQGWQVTGQYYPGGWSRTYRPIGPGDGSVISLKEGPAPGNRCPIVAFEVLNPKPGEARCIGFVLPY